MKRIAVFVALAMVVLALDQGSKAWAHTLPVGVPQPVIAGYFDWQLSYNDGVAFSLLQGGGAKLVLVLVALAAVVVITRIAWRTPPEERAKRIGYALIAGGALGNLVDRLWDGAVTDFVRVHWHEHMWPIFNLADAALFVGVAVLLVRSFFERRPPAGHTVEA